VKGIINKEINVSASAGKL